VWDAENKQCAGVGINNLEDGLCSLSRWVPPNTTAARIALLAQPGVKGSPCGKTFNRKWFLRVQRHTFIGSDLGPKSKKLICLPSILNFRDPKRYVHTHSNSDTVMKNNVSLVKYISLFPPLSNKKNTKKTIL